MWGMDMPQGTVQSLNFHPAGDEGQPGQGGASSGRPGPSRASSVLARVLDKRLPEGVEVLGLSPIIQMGTCPGPRGLCRSSTGCFWAHFIFTPLAGQPTAKMFKYVSPDSPRHLLFPLGEARGSDCGHILGLPNKRGASLIRHIWGAVGPSWDFTADVTGAAGGTGEAGTAGVAGVSGVPRHAGITGAAAVTPAAGVTGEPGPARVVVVTSLIGGSGAAVITGVGSGGAELGGDGPPLRAGWGSGRLSGLLP